MPLPGALRLVPDLDVRPRHLPDLADLAALAPDHAANELRGGGSSALPKAQARPAPPSPTRALGSCSRHWEPRTPGSWSARQDPVLGRRGVRVAPGLSCPPRPWQGLLAPGTCPALLLRLLTWHHAWGGKGDRVARELLELGDLSRRRGAEVRGGRGQRRLASGRGASGWGHSPPLGSQPHTDSGRRSPAGMEKPPGEGVTGTGQGSHSSLDPQFLLPSPPFPTRPPVLSPHLVGGEKDGA